MLLLITLILFCASAVFSEVQLIDLKTANNLFISDVYKQISRNNNANLLVSPLSAGLLLGPIWYGSKGETARELQETLHIPNDLDFVKEEVNAALSQLEGNKDYTLKSASKIYMKSQFKVKESFREIATSVFRVKPENLDFTKANAAAQVINNWVQKKTQHKIKNLVDPGVLNNRTRLVLVNALYFKSDWLRPFPLAYTEKIDFSKTADDVVKVYAMHSKKGSFFNYFECPHMNAKILELPFEGEEATMVFVLPNEKNGLAALERNIDMVFQSHDFKKERVNVVLPKFRIRKVIDFKKILKRLGVEKVFIDDEADLSGIAGEQGDLVLDKVVQKTFIDVSEKGVEAAAATYAVVAVPLSGFIHPPKQFIADHPFIFYVKVKSHIIFVGRVTSPTY